jgi:hypothetical protein
MRETRMEYIRRVVHLCKPDVCSEWPFSKDSHGAGQVWESGETQQAHRYAWQLVNGPIPKGFGVHHSCDNQSCFNPHHLFIWAARKSPKGVNLDYLEKAIALCVPDACSVWPFPENLKDYGRLSIEGVIHPVHRVAWELVNGPIPPGLFACHKCDNPPCFNPFHIFLGTSADNAQDMADKGRSTHGESNPCARLTGAQVLEIRRKYQPFIYTQNDLAREYGVHRETIYLLLAGKTWKRILSDS